MSLSSNIRNTVFLFVVVCLAASFSSNQKVQAATDQSAPTESEVLVVYNSSYTTDSDSSGLQDSQQIAQYYKSKRPGVSIVGLPMPTTEEITWDQFNTNVKAPLEDYLTTNNLIDTYKIIVTVKGVPLKIMGDQANNISKITSGGSSSIFSTTGLNPYTMTIDSSGNIYTANYYSNNVTKIASDGSSSTLGTTGSHPRGITVDGDGNVYVANYSDNTVTKITAAGVSSTLADTGIGPRDIVIDASGNLYTANSGANTVTKITAAGVASTLGTTSSQPYAITIDTDGNIYTANYGANNVTKITAAGASSTLGATGSLPYAITIDTSNNIYTANLGANTVTKITAAGASSTLGATSNSPYGIAVDTSGNVYTANYSSENVTKITALGVSSTLASSGPGPSDIVVDTSGNVYTTNAHGHHDPFAADCGSYCYDVNYASVDQGISLSFQNFKTTGRRNNPYYNVDTNFLKNSHFKLNYFTNSGFTLRYLVSRLDGYTVSDITTMIDNGVSADTTSSGYWILDKSQSYFADRMSSANTKLGNLNRNTIYDPSPYTSFITTSANPIIAYTSYGYNTGMGDGYVSNSPANANHLNFTLLPGAVFSTYESYNGYGFVAANQSTHGQLAEWEQIGGSGGIGNIYEPWSSSIADESVWMPAYAVGYPWIEAAYMSLPYFGFVQIVLGDPLMTIADITAPGAVSNFNLVQSAGGLMSLSWTNPTDPDLAGIKIVRKTSGYPTSVVDGVVIYTGSGTSTTDSGLTNNATYYYAAFAYDNTPNYSVINNDSKALVLVDSVAPGSVSNLQATAGINSVNLSWTNPADLDFAGVKVLRKTGSYPSSVTDGTVVYTGIGTSTTDNGLTNGTTYYYAAFAYDEIPNYSSLNNDSKDLVLVDSVAPGSVSNLSATTSSATVNLSWTNPTDLDLVGIKLVRKTGSYPTSYTDGTLIYNGLLTSAVDSGLNNGTIYYYAAFAYDLAENYSVITAGSRITAIPNQPGGGGGGGGGGGSSVNYCTAVNYSDWSIVCLGDKQYRSVVSSVPSSCTMTIEQQLALQRNCQNIINQNTNEQNNNEENPINNEPLTNPVIESVIDKIINESNKIIPGKFEDYYVTALGNSLDEAAKQKAAKKYKEIINADKKFTSEEKDLILDFIFYGTPLTKILGEGERAGVINSYFRAYNILPNSAEDWQDVLKIANGRWPSYRDSVIENKAKATFKKVYGHTPNMKNNIEENAIMVMAYGLLPAKRNLFSEQAALKSFKWIYNKLPNDSFSWNIVRAIAYSGAKK